MLINYKHIALLSFTLLMCSCASNYTSIDQVRTSPAQKSITVAVPLEQSFDNLITQVNECFALNLYKVVSIKKDKSAEISVISAGSVSGSNVWLSIKLQEVSDAETGASLYWGNVNWEKHAEKAAKWAAGYKEKC